MANFPPTTGQLSSRWRTVKQIAADLQFSSEDACRTWLRRKRVPRVKRGRALLIDPRDVDAALRKVVA